jgi:BASS family bile acid:Na+ symporter
MDILDLTLRATLAIFMAGSLGGLGLGLGLPAAASGLRNVRFLALGLFVGFVLGPLVALLLSKLLPLAPPYAAGLLLLGMTPGAPFLPMVVGRAGGDPTDTAAMLLLLSVATVVLLPVLLPLGMPDLSVSAWSIARPLLVLVLLPLGVGMAIFGVAPRLAAVLRGPVKVITGVATVLMLALCIIIYEPGFVSAFGSFAILAQLLFLTLMTACAYALGIGLPTSQRSVLSLAVATRNIGAAIAPLFSALAVDRRAVIMVMLAVPVQVVVAFGAARILSPAASTMSRSQ